MKKKKRNLLILGIFYLVGLVAGLAAMLLIPYYQQFSNLMDFAQSAASYYLENGTLNNKANFGLDFLVYDTQGNCLEQVISGFSDSVYSIDTEEALACSRNGTTLFYDRVVITAENGSRTQLSVVTAVPLEENGSVTGCLIMIRDLITVENNLLSFAAVWTAIFLMLFLYFSRVHKMEKKFDRLQRNYIAAMNHELKSPITSIKALSETLLDGYESDPEKQLFCHSTILKEAQRLEDTVCEILELSKLQNTKDIYRKQPAAPEEILAPTLERYACLCEDIDRHFSAPDLHATALPTLYTAPDLIARVLDLLLHNAVKFTPEETGKISVDIRKETGHIEVCVRDNGCGISKEALPHIFERFYRSGGKQNKSGSGLGLSIVREIITGLDEKISVDSAVGEGTVFTFTVGTKIGKA